MCPSPCKLPAPLELMGLPLLSPEARLLFLVAGAPTCDPEIERLLADGIDFRRLYAFAARERALPVLWDRLNGFDDPQIPDEVAASLRRHASVSHFRLLHLDQRLNEAVDVLQAAKIPVLLLKGAALGRTVYSSPVQRPMIDLDLLIRPEHAEGAVEVLAGARWRQNDMDRGKSFYRDHHHEAPLDDADGTGFTLELHTRPVRHADRFGLPAERVWAAAREVRVEDRSFLVPSTPHQLLHLAVHFAWSHVMASSAWRTFRDVATICDAETVDWDHTVRLAAGSAAASCCYWTFRFANRLSAADIPDEVIAALRPRTSKMLLDRLERHYISEFLPLAQRCPSFRLRRAIWALGIRPGEYGRSPERPWNRSRDYLREYGSSQPDSPPDPDRFIRRVTEWQRYLRFVTN